MNDKQLQQARDKLEEAEANEHPVVLETWRLRGLIDCIDTYVKLQDQRTGSRV